MAEEKGKAEEGKAEGDDTGMGAFLPLTNLIDALAVAAAEGADEEKRGQRVLNNRELLADHLRGFASAYPGPYIYIRTLEDMVHIQDIDIMVKDHEFVKDNLLAGMRIWGTRITELPSETIAGTEHILLSAGRGGAKRTPEQERMYRERQYVLLRVR